MSIFDAQYIRKKHNLSWGEDYMLGLVDRTAPITTMRAIELGEKLCGLTNVTIQTKLKSLVAKNLVAKKKDKDDGRLVIYSLTEKGKRLVGSLRDAVK